MVSVARTCLIVDDLEHVRLVFNTALHHAGFTIVEAANSDEGTVRLRELGTQIDVIVCDVHMPGKSNGLDFAEFVRSSYPTIPILLATAYCEDERIRQFDWIQKPFSCETLVARVRAISNNGTAPQR